MLVCSAISSKWSTMCASDELYLQLLRVACAELHARHRKELQLDIFPGLSDWLANEENAVALLRLATQIGLFGLLFSALERWLAPDLFTKIQQNYPQLALTKTSHFAMATFQKEELRQVLEHFEKKGIAIIVLKGPLLAEEIYGDTFSRACADIDVLVTDDSFSEAREELLALGYKESERLDEALNMDEYHHIVFYKDYESGFKTAIELHVRLRSNRFGGVSPSFQCLLENTEICPSPFSHRRLLPHLLYGHFVLEIFKDGGSLKRLVDLEALRLTLSPKGDAVRELCSQWGLTGALAYAESLLLPIRQSLNEEKSETAEEELLQLGRELNRKISPKELFGFSLNTSMRLLYGYYILGGSLMAFRYILWWAIFPPKAVMARRLGLSSESFLVYLIYPFSPLISLLYVLGIWRRTW